MVSQQEKREPDRKSSPDQKEPSLKGTLVGVLFIGGFIAVTWFSIFSLFLSRN